MKTFHEHMLDALRPARADAMIAVTRNIPADRLSTLQMFAAMEEAMARAVSEDDPYDIEAAFSTPYIVNAATLITRKLSRADANSLVTETWNRYATRRAGNKIYEVAPGLSEHLFATSAKGVKTDLLKLPFPAIYVVVPKSAGLVIPKNISDAIAEATNLESLGEVEVEGMYISEVIWKTQGKRSWMFNIIGKGSTSDDKKFKDGLIDKTIYTFEQPLPVDTPIGVAMAQRDKWLKEHGKEVRASGDNLWDRYFEWAMNLILYLTYEPNPEIEEIWNNKEAEALKRKLAHLHGSEKKKAKERLKGMNPERRLYVGRHHARLADAEHVEAEHHEGRKLTVRVLVTGHYRNQPFGTGRQERKLIWIKPFWKGPTGAPISNPRRIVT